jgi:hypothetical protein
MFNNPINLAVRFGLEIAMLIALGMWGAKQSQGWKSTALAIALPLLAAAVWGIFRTPEDHGKGLIATPGIIRLLIEFGLFAAAIWALSDLGRKNTAWWFAGILLLHYLVSYDRIGMLLKK